MLSFERIFIAAILSATLLTGSACTVEPLYASKKALSADSASSSTPYRRVVIEDVEDRVAQQVRNHLIFGLNGGGKAENPIYSVALNVTSYSTKLSVATTNRVVDASGRIRITSPQTSAAQVEVRAKYTITRQSDSTIVKRGSRVAIAGYDITPQSFATQRAERDAQNRAARELAEQLRLALVNDLSG